MASEDGQQWGEFHSEICTNGLYALQYLTPELLRCLRMGNCEITVTPKRR